ncbi:sequestosome-1-like [Dunckerocampus dactyliophorus]|uniref:sequestosome-1-like n=1 Tax=Dunckerocampus dactyliophorus TaxID=161453 RepID=UPI002407372A|nr:sequestosome-1-like [Dunckerocampus dactyliophorus]
MPMTVKAYLLGDDDAVREIRRFTVDQDVSSIFEYLSGKSCDVFSNLQGSTFKMFYRDEDEDLVAFSTDEELGMGLACMEDGTLRIFIKEKEDVPLNALAPSTFNPQPTCAGCNGPVVGVRFKCSICPNYNLCSDCQAQGTHAKHGLLPISEPLEEGCMRSMLTKAKERSRMFFCLGRCCSLGASG